MRNSTGHLPRQMPTAFNELNAWHPLRPINDEIDRKNAEEVMDRLAVLGIGAGAISMILCGDRPITADHARKLGKHFDLSPAVFL